MKKTLLEMMEEDAAASGDTFKAIGDVAERVVRKTSKIYTSNRKYPILGTLKNHQIKALNEAGEKAGHAWFMDPGGGKTLTAIAEAGRLYEAGKIDGMIVIAPMGPHIQWIDEQLPLWAAFRWKGIHNKQPPVKVIKKFMEARITALGVLSINIDAVRTPKGQALIKQFMEKFPRIYLVVDESHKIKSPRAMRTKEVLKLGLRVDYRRVLTGTPILKGLEDLWSQYEFVEPGLAWDHEPISVNLRGTLNTYGFIGYRSHYCKLAPVPGNPRASRIVGYRNEEELRERVRSHSTRVMSDEFMKGEKPDFIPVRCDMSDKQKSAYITMREHLLALVDSGTVTAANALVQMSKLQQISSGFLIDENKEITEIGSNKTDAAMNLIEQLDEPVIIWAPFVHLQTMMVDRLESEGYGSKVYRRDDVDAWKKDDAGIMVGNQGSGLGVGMNLQHAAANIYLTNSFSAEARWQSVKRTDRIGQERQVRVWDLIAPDTVDGKALKSLSDKEDVSRMTIDELRNMLI